MTFVLDFEQGKDKEYIGFTMICVFFVIYHVCSHDQCLRNVKVVRKCYVVPPRFRNTIYLSSNGLFFLNS